MSEDGEIARMEGEGGHETKQGPEPVPPYRCLSKTEAWSINEMVKTVHTVNEKWWRDLNLNCGCPVDGTNTRRSITDPTNPGCLLCRGTGHPLKPVNVGEKLMLITSELSEALEGDRKGLMDDKLPHRKMLEVELADALIRIFDLAGGLGLDLGGAYVEKMAFNAKREDHKLENRLKDGGKKY